MCKLSRLLLLLLLSLLLQFVLKLEGWRRHLGLGLPVTVQMHRLNIRGQYL